VQLGLKSSRRPRFGRRYKIFTIYTFFTEKECLVGSSI